MVEQELHLGSEPDIIVPDLAGWRRDRMPRIPRDDAFIKLPPDWVCEVLSPSTQSDRGAGSEPHRKKASTSGRYTSGIGGQTCHIAPVYWERS